jgi:hypothetical protein
MQIPDRFWIAEPPISPFIARDNRREIVTSNEITREMDLFGGF